MADPTLPIVPGTVEYLALAALARGGTMHGFRVLEWIEETSGGELLLEEGALYPALHRMEKRGWLTSEWKTSEKGRRARYYAITAKGRTALTQETRGWERYVSAVAKVAGLWRAVGMLVETMTPEHHDRVLAITSHLPHLIAYTIVGTVADLEEHLQSEVLRYAAGGFTDFTRIAGSDPVMWRDVFLHNREAVLEMLGRFTEDLAALQRAIRWGDGEALFNLFTRTRAIRRGIISLGQETPEPDFGRRREE